MKWVISIQLFLCQSVLSTNIHPPIKKLLVSINQSFTFSTNVLTELVKQRDILTWSKIQETSFANKECSNFIFEENHVFIEEETPQSDKIAAIEEELDWIDIDGIGNFLDLPGLMLINGECGNLKVSLLVESLLEIMTERRSQKFYKPIYVNSLTCYKRDLGQYDFSVLGKMPPGKMPPGKMPPGKVPPENYPPEINPPGKLLPGKLPLPPPPKKSIL